MIEDTTQSDDRGFGLIEVIIAMLLLALIAVAIMPVLWQGIRISGQQSSVATATRFLNSLVEEARDDGGCDALPALLTRTESDGRGDVLTVSGSCSAAAIDTLSISVSGSGQVLASTTALIYTP